MIGARDVLTIEAVGFISDVPQFVKSKLKKITNSPLTESSTNNFNLLDTLFNLQEEIVEDERQFLEGHQTPMFFGSAINNFGVQEVLDALVDLAPPPGSRHAIQREVQPDETKFSGVVFKIQANMDPAHRDRIAFVRVASGRFERGMNLKVVRSGKTLRPNTVVTFMSQKRELLDEAFAGDIIGIPNHGVLQLGDTLTEGEALQFTGLPFFAPEMFRSVEVADPLKTKQLRAGLTQLGEEGAIQVFRPILGTVLLLGAVGQLQFEVVAHRLKTEYGVQARIAPARQSLARWVTADDETELKRFIAANDHRMAYDAVDAPTALLHVLTECSRTLGHPYGIDPGLDDVRSEASRHCASVQENLAAVLEEVRQLHLTVSELLPSLVRIADRE